MIANIYFSVKGLIPLVDAYLDYINCDSETYRRVKMYLDFIEKRAKGELMTTASKYHLQYFSILIYLVMIYDICDPYMHQLGCVIS